MASRSRVRETSYEIQKQIEEAVRRHGDLDAKVQAHAEEVRDHWKFVEAPVDTGEYAASIKVRKAKPVNGLPARRVVATDWKAHFLEYGTGDPGPTKAYAPGEKTAHHFGGTLDEGVTGD